MGSIGGSGKNFYLDIDELISTRLLIQANSGGGKSVLVRRLLEQSHGKVQQLIIDLEGEFYTLRSQGNYILAGHGKDADCQLEPRVAKPLARKLLELGTSAILDVSEMHRDQRLEFVASFLMGLLDAPKKLWHPVLVVIDEAHQFCPENGGNVEARDAVIDLMTRGRKRGQCGILATQRLSKLSKDAAAECNNKLIGRCVLDVDVKRAADEMGLTSKEARGLLRGLKPGQFYAYGPATNVDMRLVYIAKPKSTHPRTGVKAPRVRPPTKAIKAALKKLVDIPQELQEEEDKITRLQKTITGNDAWIRKLRDKITLLERSVAPAVDTRAMVKSVERFVASVQSNLVACECDVQNFVTRLADLRGQAEIFKLPEGTKKGIVRLSKIAGQSRMIPELIRSPQTKLPLAEQRILDALAWFDWVAKVAEPTKRQVAGKAGYAAKGGAFNNPLSRLNVEGRIERQDGRLWLTEAGKGLARWPDEHGTLTELHDSVLATLPGGTAKRMFKLILKTYPLSVEKAVLAEGMGMSPTGGAFNNPLSKLSSLGLIKRVDGGVIASDEMFPRYLR